VVIFALSVISTVHADEVSHDAKRAADVQHDEAVSQAKAEYKEARAKCNDLGGNPKDVCIKEAKAAKMSTIADANAAKKNAATSAEASEDKREAEFKVAKAKCDSMSGNSKDICEKEAETRYRQ